MIETIKIVSVDSLLIYEEPDPRRTERLVNKIPKDQVFINPVIVGRVSPGNKFVLIDGVNRFEALRRLNVKFILAQVVNYFEPREVQLYSNVHFLKNQALTISDLQQFRLTEMDYRKASELTESGQLIGYLRDKKNGSTYSLGNHQSLKETIIVLNSLVDQYSGKTEVYRKSESIPDDFRYEIGFRRFKPQEIVRIIEQGLTLHSGITRHVVRWYALRINLPLEVLSSRSSLDKKNHMLEKFLLKKIQTKLVRYYPSPTYLFDEWRKEHNE